MAHVLIEERDTLLPGFDSSDEGTRTFVLHGEGHTLGNALKEIIVRYPEVNYCGYTIPHPTEDIIHLRIQCKGCAMVILKQGFTELLQICEFIQEVFESQIKEFIDHDNK